MLGTLSMVASAQALAPVDANAPTAAAHLEKHKHHDFAKRQEHSEQRQAELKQKLQLNAAQESAWNNLAATLRPASSQAMRPERSALENLSTPERVDRMRVLRNQRMAEMDRRGEATKAFYAVLSADQKKIFDAETVRHGRGGHHVGKNAHQKS